MLIWPDKDPSAQKDYGINWAARLALDDTIQTSTWSVNNGALVYDTPGISGHITKIWLRGGTPGVYYVTNRITTDDGITDEQTVRIQIINT